MRTDVITVSDMVNGVSCVRDIAGYDLERNHTISVQGEINDDMAELVCTQLRFLEKKFSGEDTFLVINSPGGNISSGFMIFDQMRLMTGKVYTFGTGIAASMGAFLLAAGDHGCRYLSPNCDVMIHEPIGMMQGNMSTSQSIDAVLRLKKSRQKLADILAGETGKSPEEILKSIGKDNWMEAKEAVDFGIADHIGSPWSGNMEENGT